MLKLTSVTWNELDLNLLVFVFVFFSKSCSAHRQQCYIPSLMTNFESEEEKSVKLFEITQRKNVFVLFSVNAVLAFFWESLVPCSGPC